MNDDEVKQVQIIAYGILNGIIHVFRFFLKQVLLPFVIIGAMCYLGTIILDIPTCDDTDGVDKRSGMLLFVDYGTGCEYLSTNDGGIIPRYNKEGDQMGCR